MRLIAKVLAFFCCLAPVAGIHIHGTSNSACAVPPAKKQQLRGPVLEEICKRLGSASFLVFGTGYDSHFWLKNNPDGRTVFIENHADWLGFQPPEVKNASLIVKYSSNYREALEKIHDEQMLAKFYDEELPARLKHVHWDVILVDSPEGSHLYAMQGKQQPGRGQSIYAASRLARSNTQIFVDDCEREVESEYAKNWLLPKASEGKMIELDNGHKTFVNGKHVKGRTCLFAMA